MIWFVAVPGVQCLLGRASLHPSRLLSRLQCFEQNPHLPKNAFSAHRHGYANGDVIGDIIAALEVGRVNELNKRLRLLFRKRGAAALNPPRLEILSEGAKNLEQRRL